MNFKQYTKQINYKSLWRFEVLLLLIAIIAFYQVAFLQYSLKWDNIIGYGTRRYAISQLLQEGIFPLWRSYINGGLPPYGDFIATWSPLIMTAGWLTEYTILTMHFFFIFYVYIAGLGIYKLVNYLIKNKKVAFIAGVSYMLSGMIVSHGQHMNIIGGTAWLPWIFLFYIKLNKELKWKYVIYFVIIAYITITDSYPAIGITAIYSIAAFGIFIFIRYLKEKDSYKIKRFLLLNISSVIILSIMGIGLIYTYMELSQEVIRFKDASLINNDGQPFTIQSYLSYIFPHATISDPNIFDCHKAMNNAYIGIFLFVFGVAGLFIKRNGYLFFFLGLAIFWLWAALGDDFGLKTFLYEYVPGMNKNRLPAIMRIPATFGLLLVGAYGLNNILKNKPKIIPKLFLAISITLTIVLIISLLEINISDFDSFKTDNSLWVNILEQNIFTLSLILIFTFLAFKKRIHILTVLVILVPLDMFISVQLNVAESVVSTVDPIKYYKQQTAHPIGYPTPTTNMVSENTNVQFSFGPSWKSGSVFKKDVSYEGYNPLILDKHRASFEDKKLADSTIQNAVIYVTSDVRSIENRYKDSIFDRSTIYLSEKEFSKISHHKNSKADVQIKEFQPNMISIQSKTDSDLYLVFLQTNYPGWKSYIDQKETKIYTANHQFMAIYLPKGEHEVLFEFKKPLVKFFSIFNIFLVLATILLILLFKYKSFNRTQKTTFISLIICILVVVIVRILTPNRAEQRKTDFRQISSTFRSWTSGIDAKQLSKMLLVDNHFIAKSIDTLLTESKNINSQSRYYTFGNISEAMENLDKIKSKYLFYAWSNTFVNENIAGMIYANYPTLLKDTSFNRNQILLLSKDKNTENQKRLLLTYKDRHNGNPAIDTSKVFYGKDYYKIEKEKLYGGGIRIKKGDLFTGNETFVSVKSKVLIESRNKCFLVIRFYKNNEEKPIKIKDFKIDLAINPLKQWNTIISGSTIPEETDHIHVFYYKPGKDSPLWIDQTEIILVKDNYINNSEL
jgi:hypothetical protein